MTRQEYLGELGRLGLDETKFCIISGGVMLMYGLREQTSDIDIKMGRVYFEEIRGQFPTKRSPKYNYLYEIADNIEVAVQEFAPEDVVKIDGYLVETLELQLQWKLQNGRVKDEEDIRRIQTYLRSRL